MSQPIQQVKQVKIDKIKIFHKLQIQHLYEGLNSGPKGDFAGQTNGRTDNRFEGVGFKFIGSYLVNNLTEPPITNNRLRKALHLVFDNA